MEKGAGEVVGGVVVGVVPQAASIGIVTNSPTTINQKEGLCFIPLTFMPQT